MRTVAAIPAVGLLAGSSIGLVAQERIHPFAMLLLVAGALISVWAAATARTLLLAVTTAIVFAGGGAVLAADAWEKAWRPTLRVLFEDLAKAERARAAAEGTLLPEDDQASAIVTGILRSDAVGGVSGVSVSLQVESIGVRGPSGPAAQPVSGGILVTIAGSLAPASLDDWLAGRRVRMPVQLRRPGRYLDPGVPDGERALARSGTTLVGTVKSGALVEVVAPGSWWSERTGRMRQFARRAIERAVRPWSSRAAGIVTAIVIGDRAGLDDEVRLRLQEAGTYHVIAISGGNIAILAGLLLAACRVAGWLGPPAMVATVALLAAYAGVVSGGASVTRATLMAIVYFGSRALDHRSPPLNILWVVAATIAVADPLSVSDPGFALTFGATLAILLSQPSASASRSVETGSLRSASWAAAHAALRSMFVASLAAEAILFPVGALLFSRVSLAGVALNFLAIPLMGVAQVAGMAVVVLDLFSVSLAALAGFGAYVGAEGLVWSANLVRFVPLLTYRVAPPSLVAVILYYAAAGLAWALWRRRSAATGGAERRAVARVRRSSAACGALAGLWVLAPPSALPSARSDGRLHVTFLDVGQGDSALLRFPRGATMLVDAGGLAGGSGFDVGDRVVAPAVRSAGIRRLDYLVLTHGDPDHIGGAPTIVREFRPRRILEGVQVPRSAALAALRRDAEASAAVWGSVHRGWRASVDGVDVVARHPEAPDWERQRVRNDDSIVLDVRWRDVSILLTGDIGRDVERTVAGQIPHAPLSVLKVPHHGSRTSSSPELLRAIRPDVAVFSVGRSNRFGHPAPEVLGRYRDVGAAILRTDRDGAVFVETDGHSIDVRTFTGRRLVLTSSTGMNRAAGVFEEGATQPAGMPRPEGSSVSAKTGH